jgi:hypothetical protein
MSKRNLHFLSDPIIWLLALVAMLLVAVMIHVFGYG